MGNEGEIKDGICEEGIAIRPGVEIYQVIADFGKSALKLREFYENFTETSRDLSDIDPSPL